MAKLHALCQPMAGVALAVSLFTLPRATHGDDSTYLDIVRRYADTMIERGRDQYGAEKSGLLLSALDRRTLAPLTVRPALSR